MTDQSAIDDNPGMDAMTRPEHRPIVLIIRDGWGANPDPEWNHANAVHLARTPIDDRLRAEFLET